MIAVVDAGDVDRARIAEGLGAANANDASVVRDPDATFEELPASFLTRTRIFEVVKFRPTRPTILYVAVAHDGAVFLLNQRPDQFNEMIAHDGARIEGPAHAVELARTFVRTTRPQNRRYLLVATVDELPWMPGLEDADAARAAEQHAALVKVLTPPGASPASDGWDVELFVVDGSSLDRVTVHVHLTGRVGVDVARLFDELSLAYAL